MTKDEIILEAKNIKVSFRKENQKKVFGKERQTVLNNVSFYLKKGECLGIIGESGSGKSTLGKVILGLQRPENGIVIIDNINLYKYKNKMNKKLRYDISVVFQDYVSSVNPRFTVMRTLDEAINVHTINTGEHLDKINRRNMAIELLNNVGLDESFLKRYPHELSGGQLQRICIARAVAVHPKIILLDEAVSSLDVSTQTQLMDYLIKLRNIYGFSYIFITHDLSTITYLCDRVLFFNSGNIVEEIDDIRNLNNVKTEYALELLNSVKTFDIVNIAKELKEEKYIIENAI
ncbi:dipeptide/oligopeptide/nickel ABC transporter ATP-binding protein [uncultured Brachyspira sp.]|uniref:ABC transporter ATP-binding protein n=1 Tax=uncultured Brachyspira sp. TaxID=221953 RepID=UPI0025F01813|nr:dipeptide/oligopeptide/nickel ABC transporter ATP-binding protein [uncultured Brachyspira sp.]